jgi:hypothetical protein
MNSQKEFKGKSEKIAFKIFLKLGFNLYKMSRQTMSRNGQPLLFSNDPQTPNAVASL